MKWRKISETEVQEILQHPDKLEDTVKGRKNALKMLGGRLLKVTYFPGAKELIVVTTMAKGE